MTSRENGDNGSDLAHACLHGNRGESSINLLAMPTNHRRQPCAHALQPSTTVFHATMIMEPTGRQRLVPLHFQDIAHFHVRPGQVHKRPRPHGQGCIA